MNRRLDIYLCLLLLSSFLVYVGLKPVKVKGPIRYSVHNLDTGLNYITIQEAIGANETLDGHTILVEEGTYYEHVEINKSISLIGEDRYSTIIDGNRTGRVVYVSASYVWISGFTIRNSGRTEWGEGYGGIYIGSNTSNNIITGNIIVDGGGGVELDWSTHNTIEHNLILNNSVFGIQLYDSAENVLVNNIIMNSDDGIFLYFGSERNDVNNNTIANNGCGIKIEYAPQNTFRKNNLNLNRYGLFFGLVRGIEDCSQDIDTSNSINGKPVCYLVKQQDVLIDSSTFPNGVGFLGIVDSENVTVRNIDLSANRQGVFLAYTEYSSLENVSVSNCFEGVRLFRSHHNTISACNLSSYDGIFLEASNHNLVYNNVLSNKGYGIELYFDVEGNVLSSNRISSAVFGISSYTCYNNTITKNTISNCSSGISLRGSNHSITGNTISDMTHSGIHIGLGNHNIISDNYVVNTWGVWIGGERHTVFGNLVTHSDKGIWVIGDSSKIFENTFKYNDYGLYVQRSTNNTFYHNNIVNNTVQAYLEDTSNNWNYDMEGNYWSDYDGVDLYSGPYQNETGSDGIGDSCYMTTPPGTSIAKIQFDYYPLMGKFYDFTVTSEHHVQTICNSSISDFQFNGTAICFNVTGENDTIGFCRICIPRALMNKTYKVFVNGTEVLCNLLPCFNTTHNYLYFTYNHSIQEVVIIPEFPSFLILPLFMTVTLLTVIFHKRKISVSTQAPNL